MQTSQEARSEDQKGCETRNTRAKRAEPVRDFRHCDRHSLYVCSLARILARDVFTCHRYYKESHKILGNTYGMLVLQDFEAITPNLLARTIETVEGGGLVVLLLKTMSSLRQLYTMTMVRRILPFA